MINVALVRLPHPARPRPQALPAARRTIPSARTPPPERKNPPEVPPRPLPAIPGAPPTPEAADASAGVRTVLRGLVGCEPATMAGLSPAERQDCLERLARRRSAEVGKAPALNFDRRGDYAVKDPTPYLIRRPKDGCKPRAAGYVRPVPPGAEAAAKQGVAAGVDCAFSF